MSGSLLDEYVKKLSQLEEGPFQRAIVQRLLVAVNGFQTIPASPQGDGGLDGFSHKGVHGYCCYGLKFDSAKTPKQRSKQLATKFTDDLARLYELVPCPGGFKHKPNEALMRVFGALPPPECRLQNITLLANWFGESEALGAIRQAAIRFAAVSRLGGSCRMW